MAKRIRLGRRTELPLAALGGYIGSGLLLCFGSVQEFGAATRAPVLIAAIIAFLVGAVVHILDKIDRHNSAMLGKIDDSVGDVYDTGKQAGVRHERLAAESPRLAVVHDLSPR